MITIKCDRCGKKVESDGVVASVTFTDANCITKRIDLCPECVKSFKSWLSSKEEK